ncbi:MAG: DUF177 domain-containing protein [Desulfobulbaceae bacterium]|nr:DUF177 domain-containing protein [Desulfobulbaceae bacterium]
MLVYFDEIPPLGRDFSWKIAACDADASVALEAPLAANCHVRLIEKDKLEVAGLLQGVVTLDCDRCLVSFPFELNSTFRLTATVRAAASTVLQEEDQDIGLEDLDTIELDAPCLDLNELMRQQFLLALPQKRLCSGACVGLCPHCGTNRNNSTPCDCAQKTVDSPFAVLARLTGGKAK